MSSTRESARCAGADAPGGVLRPFKIRNTRSLRALAAATAITFFATSPVWADLVIIQAQQDNTLYEDASGSRSNGAGTAMFVGRNSQSTHSIRRAVLAFDVANAIPPGSIIESASLTLSNSAANDEDQTLGLHRVLSDWGEGSSVASGGGGSGGPASTGDATWLHTFNDTDFWATPGGDFESLISATAIVGGPGSYTWVSTPQLIADVQRFLDDPVSNFGWTLLGNETEAGTAKKFATREEPNPALQPVLTLSYMPVPEPGAFSMVCIAVIFACRKRRMPR